MRVLVQSAVFLLLAACGTQVGAPAGPSPGGTSSTPQGPDTPENPALFSVRGTLLQGPASTSPTVPLEVGVLWLNRGDADSSTVLVEVTPADAVGLTLPADFDVSILQAPSDAMLGTTLMSYTESGQGTYAADRDRIAFGLVVVAPAGTFATLPTSVSMGDFIQGSQGGPGPMLQQFTYMSPYTVRYVKGATAEGLTLRDINGVESTLQDMTVFEVSAWANGITTLVCRDRKLGEGWATQEVNDCIATQAAAQPGRSSGDIGNDCLYAWQQAHAAEFDATCGVGPDRAAADFRNIRRLAPLERLTLPLGTDDVRNALAFGGFIFID